MNSLAYNVGYMAGFMHYHSGNSYPVDSEEYEQYFDGWDDGYNTTIDDARE